MDRSGATMSVSTRLIVASADSVFRTLTDPDSYPDWLVGAKDIRHVDDAWPRSGSGFDHVVGFGPLHLADRTSVIRIEPGRLLELDVRARPVIEATVRFELSVISLGVELQMTETPAGLYRWVAPLASPLIRLRNERSLDRLATLVEQRVRAD